MKEPRKQQTKQSKSKSPLLIKDYVFALLSSLMLVLTFSVKDIGILAWFGLVPFLISLAQKTIRQRFVLTFIFSFFFFIGTLYWIRHVSMLGLICLCVYLSLELCVFCIFLPRYTHKHSLLLIPFLWVVFEYLRGAPFTGFGWALLGYTQYKNLFLIQIAEKVSVWGISFLVVLVNTAIAQIISKGFRVKLHHSCVWLPAIALCITYCYGAVVLHKNFPQPNISVSIIQGNIAQERKWAPEYADVIMQKHQQLSIKAAKETPDLIIWPETSVPGYLLDEPKFYKAIVNLAQKTNSYILVGSPRENYQTKQYYNSAFLFDPNGKLMQFHDKIHLVPFGEYVPYGEVFRFLKQPPIADFSAGNRHTIFRINKDNKYLATFGVLICFEDVFPHLVKKFRKNGADFLVTISNEAWFKKSTEPSQHVAMSVFRAVENRCWFIRCANTGISCFINPRGEVKQKVAQGKIDTFIAGFRTVRLDIY